MTVAKNAALSANLFKAITRYDTSRWLTTKIISKLHGLFGNFPLADGAVILTYYRGVP